MPDNTSLMRATVSAFAGGGVPAARTSDKIARSSTPAAEYSPASVATRMAVLIVTALWRRPSSEICFKRSRAPAASPVAACAAIVLEKARVASGSPETRNSPRSSSAAAG
eukprot:scaffold7418_cov31-Tisochrysis_lutea.AAC.1